MKNFLRGFVLAAMLFGSCADAQTAAPKEKKVAPAAPADLNTATAAELDSVPGIGAATAKKIIAGRPYSSVADLSKAGISAKQIQQISPMVMVKGGGGGAVHSVAPAPAKTAAPAGLVDLNTATAAQLDSVPGIGKATAAKIVAGRPYGSVSDLSKTGISARQIQQISPMVTVKAGAVGSGPATVATPSGPRMAPSAPMAPAAAAPKVPPSLPPSVAGTPGPYTPPPAAGMVWVNKETKVYHKQGDRWYGRTKQGAYMSEADAMKAGYRASKEK